MAFRYSQNGGIAPPVRRPPSRVPPAPSRPRTASTPCSRPCPCAAGVDGQLLAAVATAAHQFVSLSKRRTCSGRQVWTPIGVEPWAVDRQLGDPALPTPYRRRSILLTCATAFPEHVTVKGHLSRPWAINLGSQGSCWRSWPTDAAIWHLGERLLVARSCLRVAPRSRASFGARDNAPSAAGPRAHALPARVAAAASACCTDALFASQVPSRRCA